MTYIPLARKWRPKSFANLLGQCHVVNPIQNSLLNNKTHHAYLFTGTRGVGKTTVARIFAKALNCHQGVVSEPCLQCASCLAIDEGNFYDLIEVDGASRTRVEDTRELIENIQYAPAQGRYKIFLIDEVHMLSTHSFNALLKTIEEPPEHVKFLLATTDPQKIPPTILSRCLQFNLSPVSNDIIIEQLTIILNSEAYNFEPPALASIAKQANGSMRDAITLCEQLMATYPDGLKLEYIISKSLDEYCHKLINIFVSQDSQVLVSTSQEIIDQQLSFKKVLHTLIEHFHALALLQITENPDAPQFLQLTAQKIATKHIHVAYQILEKGIFDLEWSPNPALGFQMLLLRLMNAFQIATENRLPTGFQKNSEDSTMLSINAEQWEAIVSTLSLDGIGKDALNQTIFISRLENQINLAAKSAYLTLFTPSVKDRIEKALAVYFKQPTIKIKLSTSDNNSAPTTPAIIKEEKQKQHQAALNKLIVENNFVSRLLSECDAEIIKTAQK